MGKCKCCGTCCRSTLVPFDPRTTRDNVELLQMKANFIKMAHIGGKIWVHLSGQCIHLGDDDKCKRYDTRPVACMKWPKSLKNVWKKMYPECGYFE